MGTMPHDEGPVKLELLVDGVVYEVEAHLSGRFEPIDGRYHWGGRLASGPEVAALVRAGRRDVTLRGAGGAVSARLAEVDAWGGVRVSGVGAPPLSLGLGDR